jgi:phosphatidylinositol alpha-mannosyltransferase
MHSGDRVSLRILLTHVYAWPEVRRGGERYLHEVAAGLAAAGHQVRVVSTAPEPHRAEIRGVEVTYLRRRTVLPRRFGDLSAEMAFGLSAFSRFAYRRFDVWHALGTADAASAAIVGTVRDVRSVYTDLGITARSWRDRRADRRLFNIVVRRADRYICLSEAAARSVRRDYARVVDVLGGGVDIKEFTPAGPRDPMPTLLFPASVEEPRKNLPLMLEALAILRARRPAVRLCLAGPGDPEPFLIAAPPLAREAVVRMGVGELEDLPGLYSRSWATVLPASGEAFGLVVLESLACGTPVVTLDDGGPAELVRPGIGALAHATPASLAAACEEALDLAADADTIERCRSAAEPHDWRRGVVPRLQRIYES